MKKAPLIRSQFAALCYREKNGQTEVLLVQTLTSKTWILPKGWPMKNARPEQAAAQEAWEEGGVIGKVGKVCIGGFTYHKTDSEGRTFPVAALVYPIKVETVKDSYPESRRRKRKWLTMDKAAKKVASPELKRLLKTFDPKRIAL